MANSGTSFFARPFFIKFSADKVDQSKDIGFKMERDLEILKVAADDESTVLEGVKFSIYGPFEENAGTAASGSPLKFTLDNGAYKLDPDGTVTDLVTDANGKIKVTGLNWWKEYVIKETATIDGYDYEAGITATADEDAGTVVAKCSL